MDGYWGLVTPSEGCSKGKQAARRSLQIHDTAEAHTSLGWALQHYDFDHAGAEREFRRAIDLNPRYATAHQWYGHCLGYLGRCKESLRHTTRALELDPLSLILHTSQGGSFWAARDFDQMIERSRRALELDPNFIPLHWMLAHGYQGKGMYDEAIVERQFAVTCSNRAPVFLGELGGTLAAAGRTEDALFVLDELRGLSERRYIMAYWIALIYAGLRESEKSLEYLEKAYQERSPMLTLAKVDPRLDFVRSNSHFEDLLRRMNFPK